MDKNNIFLRISYSAEEIKDMCDNQFAVDIKNKKTRIRNHKSESKKYLIAGGVYNRKGGTVFFSVKNMNDIGKVTTTDKPFVKNCFMKYDVYIIPESL
ncbi:MULTISPECIES: hypothetical protein [Clostridium]|uniref:hypothetical protein n=1 Tax=Clostridium TaxID=1485 RepID=UPI0008253FCC|nr:MULTISPECIES: hypothetical protein [Clostridium]PJI07913.1 hypothetical protein CUB90_08550 [Clostridium sp. CT7]